MRGCDFTPKYFWTFWIICFGFQITLTWQEHVICIFSLKGTSKETSRIRRNCKRGSKPFLAPYWQYPISIRTFLNRFWGSTKIFWTFSYAKFLYGVFQKNTRLENRTKHDLEWSKWYNDTSTDAFDYGKLEIISFKLTRRVTVEHYNVFGDIRQYKIIEWSMTAFCINSRNFTA